MVSASLNETKWTEDHYNFSMQRNCMNFSNTNAEHSAFATKSGPVGDAADESNIDGHSHTVSPDMHQSQSYASLPFPKKLHQMLEMAHEKGFTEIVSWATGGAGFKIHDRAEFEAKVLPIYFNGIKYRSFLRQLNHYGFQRIQSGPNKGIYHHSLLIRERPDLCQLLFRSDTQFKREPDDSSNDLLEQNRKAEEANNRRLNLRRSLSTPLGSANGIEARALDGMTRGQNAGRSFWEEEEGLPTPLQLHNRSSLIEPRGFESMEIDNTAALLSVEEEEVQNSASRIWPKAFSPIVEPRRLEAMDCNAKLGLSSLDSEEMDELISMFGSTNKGNNPIYAPCRGNRGL